VRTYVYDGAGRKCPDAEMGHPGRVDLVKLRIILDSAPGKCDKFSRVIVHSVHFYATATEYPFEIYSRLEVTVKEASLL
jgi:hypothetical protein